MFVLQSIASSVGDHFPLFLVTLMSNSGTILSDEMLVTRKGQLAKLAIGRIKTTGRAKYALVRGSQHGTSDIRLNKNTSKNIPRGQCPSLLKAYL